MKKTALPVLVSLLLLCACNSGAESSAPLIVYTKIADCEETVENENAAFSVLDCGKVGVSPVTISQQSPIYFTVQLESGDKKRMTDFESLSGELPLEPGAALEWHLYDGAPRFLIFRLGWGTEQDPHAFRQRLVLNYVADDAICPVATVDVKNNPDANQKARDLLVEKYHSLKTCPTSVDKF